MIEKTSTLFEDRVILEDTESQQAVIMPASMYREMMITMSDPAIYRIIADIHA